MCKAPGHISKTWLDRAQCYVTHVWCMKKLPQMPCLLRTALLCDAVTIPAAIVATVFLTSFIYSCYRFLVTPALAEVSAVPVASAAVTMQAPLQKQEVPVIVVQPGEQVKPKSSQHPA